VKTSAVRAWVAKMGADEVGAPTIENAFGLLRQVLGAAVEDRRIPRNPCEGVRLPKRKHADRGYLSHGQVAALAAAVDRGAEVVRFLAYTGLRWGEMAALRVQDFDMLRRRVNVSRSVTESGGLVWSTPKTWERRSVPFPAVLADELAALMAGKGREELVFTDLRGGVLRNSNWRARVFEPAVKKCQAADESFPSITPHDLRHSAASLAISAGAECQSGATDTRARQSLHDVGCVRRPIRRGPGQRCRQLGRGDAIFCVPTAYPAATRPGLANRTDRIYLALDLVELRGFEPLTYSMRTSRATNCAIAPDR
jgi:integrase